MAMDFFQQQENARKLTRRLVILFVLAVIALVVLINLAMIGLWLVFSNSMPADGVRLPPYFHQVNTLIVLGLILGGSALEFWNLRDGGEAVARMVNGRLVQPGATGVAERRLLNIVEEMAIASGIAAPRVYVLDHEEGINAFAAGYGPNEAIVAISHGALTLLTRDELQGVVAHEFSHILNGDIRLNLRLIAVLYGILLVSGLGSDLMTAGGRGAVARRDGRGKGGLDVALLVIGLTVWLLGSIGVFFARIIKSSVSRQREYLADASAVQFTRNPDGIGGALRKLGGHGSEIVSPRAETLSHLFLGAARPSFAAGWLATHPPLAERIRRIYGRPMPMLKGSPDSVESEPETELVPLSYATVSFADATAVHANAVPPSGDAVHGANDVALTGAMPDPAPQLLAAARDPLGAQALVLAMLLASDHGEWAAQRAAAGSAWTARFDQAESLRAQLELAQAGSHPLWLDLALPVLKSIPAQQRAELLEAVARVAQADGQISLPEFVLETILARRLGPHAGRAVPVHHLRSYVLRPPLQILLSLLAHAGIPKGAAADVTRAQRAFDRGVDALMLERLLDRRLALMNREELDFAAVRLALDTLNTLPPLRKAVLVKALNAAVAASEPASDAWQTLHMVCAALDVPVPHERSFAPAGAARH